MAALIFYFSTDVYSLDTVKRAAYKFTAQFSFTFGMADSKIECAAVPLVPLTTSERGDFEKRFQNELLDQDLRHRIAEETSGLRNTILAHAFSNTGLQQVE
jgi:His-Xaa-Ser system protein HxsD